MEEDKVEVHLIGKITSDVEVKKSASGISWLSISVESVSNGYKSFNRLSAFKEIADRLASKARKGKHIKILANCGLSKNKKTDRWETNLTIFKFEILEENNNNVSEQPVPAPQPQIEDVPEEDSLPF